MPLCGDFSGAGRPVAERVGFEPTVRLPVHRISSAAHSTTLPPLREVPVSGPSALWSGAARLAEGIRLAKPLATADANFLRLLVLALRRDRSLLLAPAAANPVGTWRNISTCTKFDIL